MWFVLAFVLGLVAGHFITKWTAREREATPKERHASTDDVESPMIVADRSSTATIVTTVATAVPATKQTAPATIVSAVRTAKGPAAARAKGARRQATQAPALDLVAAKAAIGKTVKLDDLKLIEGIGPRIEGLFGADGITTWREVSTANVERLQGILSAAGPRYNISDPASWPKQAGLLADGKWADFKTLTDKLKGGR